MGIWTRVVCAAVGLFVFGFVAGCQVTGEAHPERSANVVFVLHGIDGAGPWYNGLVGGLKAGDPGDEVEMVQWGAPLLFLSNLQFGPVHDAAEHKLAKRIDAWRAVHREGRVCLVGHSAGCGVILQTLAHSDANVKVDEVLLLAPCVSESYDLSRAMSHIRGQLHVFYSGHDELLGSTFVAGTYESAWGRGAGVNGFVSAKALPKELQSRLTQHGYDPAWKALGHEGGHFGYRSRPFVERVIGPMLQPPAGTNLANASAAKKPGRVAADVGATPAAVSQ